MLELKNISISVGGFSLWDININIGEGEYFVILGQSGAGKSLLLETVAGLIEPVAGEIILDKKNITSEKIQKRKIGLVYQDATLFPHMTALKNIFYPMKKDASVDKNEKALLLAKEVQAEELLDRLPETLSGGEYQRVAIARTLASEPKILLLDEPLSSLDVKAKSELRMLLRKINREGITILHVTHDYEEAVSLASRVAIMENGEIVQVDNPVKIFQHPKSDFVARFIGIKNFIKGELANTSDELKIFKTNGLDISVLTNAEQGEAFLSISPDKITISNQAGSTSARNTFKGKVVDIAPAALGVDVTVNIGLDLVVLVTRESVEELNLQYGEEVWVNFKASSCEILSAN